MSLCWDRYLVVHLGVDIAVTCSHVHLLGTDMSLDQHISRTCAGCFCRHRQLRRLLDSGYTRLVYAVVNSQSHYCNTVLTLGE